MFSKKCIYWRNFFICDSLNYNNPNIYNLIYKEVDNLFTIFCKISSFPSKIFSIE